MWNVTWNVTLDSPHVRTFTMGVDLLARAVQSPAQEVVMKRPLPRAPRAPEPPPVRRPTRRNGRSTFIVDDLVDFR